MDNGIAPPRKATAVPGNIRDVLDARNLPANQPPDLPEEGDRAASPRPLRCLTGNRPPGASFHGFYGGDMNKEFKTVALDIHKIVDGKIKQSYHIEDWHTALEQMLSQPHNPRYAVYGHIFFLGYLSQQSV